MSNSIPPQEDIFVEKNQVDFKLLAAKMLRNWYWFLLSIVVFMSVSYIYLRYTTPIFRTTAKILIKSDQNQSSGEDAMAKALNSQFSTSSNVEGEVEIFKTRHLMEQVVRNTKAYIGYFHKGKILTVDLYKHSPILLTLLDSPDSIKPVSLEVNFSGSKVRLHNERYDKLVNFYEPFIVPGLGRVQIEKQSDQFDKKDTYIVNVVTIKSTVSYLLSKLEVSIPIKQVDMIYLSFTDPVSDFSENVLNKLIKAYTDGNLLDKNQIADSTISFIDNRLLYVGKELGNVEGNVQTFKQRNKLADLTAQSSLLVNSTADYLEQRAKAETQLSIIGSVEKYLEDSGTNQRLVPSGGLLDDPNFADLVARYNGIVLEKEKRSIGQTEDNPYMQNLNNQIALARADMLSSLKGMKRALTISLEKIDARSNMLAGKVNEVPVVERGFLDLSRQQQIKQELYVFLLQKREETAISKTSNTSNCKIIEPPASVGPISPIRTNILGYGFLVGLLIPFASIFVADRLNNKINSKEQVTNNTQVSIIGEIGKSANILDTIVVDQGSRTPISEQFRALRTNLAFFLNENEKTILLTSSMSGEGKSFIAINLATVLAISGKKVVIMEMDLRKPNLSNKLRMKNDFGFTNYIVSPDVAPADIIKPSGTHENLFIINSGNIPPNPTEIILNKRMDVLIKYLDENFDNIIIDAPPIGMVTDAQLLSKYSDLTLYVVRQGFTFKEQLEIPQEIYVNKKMHNIAILMNDVKSEGRYGYGYGYGYGLEQDDKKGFFARIFKK
ncbi:GumC family protein [Pedobacter hartonius]|uniref:Capsular exopolysaccharide family n=1 Tax=Pedobacter hartonius TaxID=425514 RepID=A0A1H4FP94_9SPHI|nr:polysaccharide biosynthesis tyrosine autokinase [Pedobacter hartonius]SEA98961.1 capsular exopolysaccharide family [Pedobacter hartonius]